MATVRDQRNAAGKVVSYQGIYRDAVGRRHTKTWPTKTAARRWAQDAEASVRGGTHRNPRAGRVLFGAWHARWTAARVVEESTRKTGITYAKDVLAKWGDWPLDAITRMDVQGWVRQLEQDGRGAHAIGRCAQQLMLVLESAVPDLIPANVARGVSLPEKVRRPNRILSIEEEAAIIAAVPQPEYRWMLEVMFETGMRWGEVAGLRGDRVEMLRRELHVVETLTQTGQAKAGPKSGAGVRVIPLEPRALDALAASMERWDGRDGLVFRTPARGRPVLGDNFRTKVWAPAVLKAKIAAPLPTPHDIRHTALSRLVANGVDVKVVQVYAGHASMATTMRYLHAAPDADDRVRMALRAVAEQRRIAAAGADLAQAPQRSTTRTVADLPSDLPVDEPKTGRA